MLFHVVYIPNDMFLNMIIINEHTLSFIGSLNFA